MHVYRRRGAVALAAILAAVACSDTQTGTLITNYIANLDAAQEQPTVVSSAGSGTATCTFSPAVTARPLATTATVSCTVNWSGLTDSLRQAHIHAPNAAATNTGAVNVWLCTTTGITAPAGTATCPQPGQAGTAVVFAGVRIASTFSMDSLYGDFLSGAAYVNLHTKTNPGGEIRGVLLHPLTP